MLENHHVNKYEQLYKGPYLVMQVNTNGTVHFKIGAVTDAMNIRHIHPYKMMSSNANHGGKCSMHHSIAQVQCMSYQTMNNRYVMMSIWMSTIICRSHAASAHRQDYTWSASPCNP